MSSVFDLVATLSLDSSAYDAGLMGAKTRGMSFGSMLKNMIGIQLVMKGIQAVGDFAKSSIEAGKAFDSSMSQVAATMGKTMDEMEKEVGTVQLAWGEFSGNLRDYAMEMGKNTAFSAKQASDALNYMALAGYDVQTSMEMLPNVLNLAAAGSMDLARASDMVTDTQTAFGMSLERTSQMVDEMAKAASTGNTSVEQLGDAFLVVGGLAQELNGGFVTLKDGTTQSVDGIQELEIALTAMANAGVKGSEAGTHMRNMILKLSNPTSDGAKTMERLGVAVFDAEGQMRSMKDIMGDLSTAMGDLTQEEKISAIGDLFNTRDMAAAEALLNAVNQDWDGIGESILDAQGAAQKMADTQLDNLQGDVTLFKSALEGAQIVLSDQLNPTLREFVQFGTRGISEITSAFQEGGLEGAMSKLGTLISDFVGMLIDDMPTIVNAGAELLSSLVSGLIDNIPALAEAAMTIITNLGDKLAEAAPNIGPAIRDILVKFSELISNNINTILDIGIEILDGLVEGIVDSLPVIIPAVIEILMTITDALIDHLDELLSAAMQLIIALAEGIISALPTLVGYLPQIITTIVQFLTDNLPAIIDAGTNLFLALVDALPDVLIALTQALPALIDAVVEFLTSEASGEIFESALLAFLEIVAALPEILGSLLGALGQVIGAVLKGIINFGKNMADAGLQLFLKIITGLNNAAGKIVNAVKSKVSEWVDAIKGKAKDFVDAGANLITGLWNGINNKFEWVKNKVASLGQGILKKLKEVFKENSPSKATAEMGEFLAEGLAVGWDNEIDAVMKDMSSDLSISAEVESKNQNPADKIIDYLATNLPSMLNLVVKMDTGETVGVLVRPMDRALGELAYRNTRMAY